MTLTLSAEGKAVSNAAVDVVGGPLGRPSILGPVAVNNAFLHPNIYEVDVSLSTSGQWLFTFMIRAPSGDEDIKVQIDVGVAAASAASGG